MARNPQGYIPVQYANITARKNQNGVIGIDKWLKREKMHKYWPLISHWTFYELSNLYKRKNIEELTRQVDCSQLMPEGAADRLLRMSQWLRERSAVAQNIINDIRSGNLCSEDLNEFESLIHSPIVNSPHDPFNILLIAVFNKILDDLLFGGQKDDHLVYKFRKIYHAISVHPVLGLCNYTSAATINTVSRSRFISLSSSSGYFSSEVDSIENLEVGFRSVSPSPPPVPRLKEISLFDDCGLLFSGWQHPALNADGKP